MYPKRKISGKMLPIFSGLFLLLPESVVRTGNRGRRTRGHRDQDEPDGPIRDQRAGTAHDTGNPE
jgi:hypothetical protein